MSDPEAVEAHEHRAWEGAAPVYSEFVAGFTANSGQLGIIREMVDIGVTDRVLDVGCGPGVLSAQLKALTPNVVGIDFSAAMIAEAQRLQSDLRFEVANVESLPFGDHSFDVAVVNYCAHHLARPATAFAELRRVLASDGRLVIVHPIQAQQPSWGSFAESVGAVLPPETVPGGALLDAADPQVYIDLLVGVGFGDVRCEAREKPVTVGSLDVLLEAGWVIADLENQPQEIQDRIEQGVRDRAAPYRNADDSYTFPDVVLAASARA